MSPVPWQVRYLTTTPDWLPPHMHDIAPAPAPRHGPVFYQLKAYEMREFEFS